MIHDARKHLLLANPGLDRKTFLLLGREGSMVLTHRQGSSFLHVAVPRSVRLDILSRDAKIYSGWGLQRALSLAAPGNTGHVAVSAKMGALESADIGASFTFPGPGTGITQGGCYTCLLPAMNQRGPGGAWCGNCFLMAALDKHTSGEPSEGLLSYMEMEMSLLSCFGN